MTRPAGPDARAGALHRHRRALVLAIVLVVAGLFVVFVLPQIADVGATVRRLRQGDKRWLAAGVVFEVLSLGGYIALFRTVFSCDGSVGWRASYEITMAGVVATKLLAAAGAGGVALTVWALRASGLDGRTVARRMAAFQILLYAVYMGALVVVGIGLASGLLHGSAPRSVTVVPAAFAAAAIVLAIVFGAGSGGVQRGLNRLAARARRGARALRWLAALPRTIGEGLGTAVSLVASPRPGLAGAFAYWGFDIATLVASFHAFGASPPLGVVVMAYFVGMLANAIPLPGGIGGVEGGMIGVLLAFGVPGATAVLGVLCYRAISFWLPTLPGAFAYMQLRRTVARWRDAREGRTAPSALLS